MGLFGSKEANPDDFVYKTSTMYYDEDGNLRFGGPERDVEDEVEQMMRVDKDDSDDDVLWYVVETAWVNAWLAYAHYGRGVSPYPGPVNNNSLIVEDPVKEAWVPKQGLLMATAGRAGDYRKVTKECWEVIEKFYKGSGPVILAKFSKEDPGHASGLYDTSNWTVTKEYVKNDKKRKKKKKKKVKQVSDERSGSQASVDLGQTGIKMSSLQKPVVKEPLSAAAAARVAAATAADSDDEEEASSLVRPAAGAQSASGASSSSSTAAASKVDDKFVEDLLFS